VYGGSGQKRRRKETLNPKLLREFWNPKKRGDVDTALGSSRVEKMGGNVRDLKDQQHGKEQLRVKGVGEVNHGERYREKLLKNSQRNSGGQGHKKGQDGGEKESVVIGYQQPGHRSRTKGHMT